MEKIESQQTGQGRDIVLLHGWASNGQIWQPLVDLLSPRFRVTVIDLPGYGSNQNCACSEDLSEIVDRLHACIPESSLVVGWSLGGLVALQLASRYPQQVNGLCLIASNPCFVASNDWSTAMDPTLMSAFQSGLATDAKATVQRFVALQCHGDSEAKPIRRVLRCIVQENQVDDAVLAQGLRLLERDQRALLGSLSLPVHFVLGEQDAIVPASLMEQLSGFGAHVSGEVWSDCAHLPFLSETTRMADCIAQLATSTGASPK